MTTDLHSDRLSVAIDSATGALASITDRRDGRTIADASFDWYGLQPTADRQIRATERDDRVVARHGDTLTCQNPALPDVLIEKRYTVQGRLVSKHVRFRGAARDVGYFKYGSSTTVPAEFFKGGYLNNPSRHVVNKATPYIQAAGITREYQVFDVNPKGDHYLVIFTNPQAGRGLAQYRFKVDGHYSHPLSSYAYEPSLHYSPTGWRMGAAAKWLSDDREELSCEIRWHLFEGDHLAFHNEYLNLPEVRDLCETTVPQWMNQVKGIISWDFQGKATSESGQEITGGYEQFPAIKAMADALSSGYLMILVRGVFPAIRAFMHDPIPTSRGVRLPRHELQEMVRRLKTLSPRIRVGPVTWQWAFQEKDPVFHEHPEWTVHTPDGQPHHIVTAWEKLKASAQLLTPEARSFVLDQYAGIVKTYEFDFIYMDTGQGGITLFDWRSKRSAQDYDWAMLFKGIRDAARSNGGGTFFNGIPNLFSLYSDIGYYEGMTPFREHWQAKSDRLVLAKVYQRPITKRTIPLYAQERAGGPNEDYYRLCYALAVKPGGFDYRGEYDPQRWPVEGALLEIESAELVPDARWEPCWWRRKTEIEVYALRLPNAALLTVHGHAKSNQTAETSFDLTPFGFDPAKPLHLWRFDAKSAVEVLAENAETTTEARAAEHFARTGEPILRGVNAAFVATVPYPAGGRFTRPVEIDADRVALLMLTQAGRLVYARDGQPTHFLLPATGSPDEKTIPADRALPAPLARAWTTRVQPDLSSTADAADEGTPFQGGASLRAFHNGAKLHAGAIEIPVGGVIEATGLSVVTIRVAPPGGEVLITYARAAGGDYPHRFDTRHDSPGEKELLMDLQQSAPPGWTGHTRLEARDAAIRIVFNSAFQLF